MTVQDEEQEFADEKIDSLDFADDYDPNPAYIVQLDDFLKVKEVVERNDRFGHFSSDFTRMLDSWKATHRREEYFVTQWRSLRAELHEVSTKLKQTQSEHLTDQKAMANLKEEVINAWRLVDEAHAREQRTQETIESLRAQVTKMAQELDLTKKMGGDVDHEAGTLAKNKEMLMKEKERLMAELLVAKGKQTKAQKMLKEMEEKLEEAERKILERGTELEAVKNDLAKERRYKDKLESDLANSNETIVSKDRDLLSQTANSQNLQKNIVKLEQMNKEQKIIVDKLTKDLAEAVSAQKVTKSELELQHATVSRLNNDLTGKLHDLKIKEEECQRLKLDEQKIRKVKENLQKKVEILDAQKADMDTDKSKLLSSINLMEKEISELKRQIVSDKKIIEALNRERELVVKAAKKCTATTTELQAAITLKDVEKKRLEEEVENLNAQVEKLQKEVKALVTERDSTTTELSRSKLQVHELQEHLKITDSQNREFENRLTEAKTKAKLQLNLFEQVRSERNKASKRLVEAEDEISELNHRLKVKSYEVEQLKEDMTSKENMLVKGEFILQKVTKEKESLRLERQKMSAELTEIKEKLQALSQEEKRLQKIVEEAEDDRHQLAKTLQQTLNERDSVSSQLKQKAEEAKMWEEKMSALQNVLKKGEAQYQQRLEDIRLLKIEIKRLRQEKAIITRNMGNSIDLRREMFHLERDYTRERLKCRALEEELSNPLNVHRWRNLEGTDPTTFELISKVQLLQKRLITASEEAIKKEAQLSDTEAKVRELESALSRQPQTDMAAKLHSLSVSVREKTSRIKILEAELSVFERQTFEYKAALDHKDTEISDVKKKFYSLKRREQKVREKENDLERSKSYLPAICTGGGAAPPPAKYVGGGFNLAQSHHKMSI